MTTSDVTSSGTPLRHQRKLRNNLLDAGLQVRYTAFINVVAIFLTVILGAKIYDATRESSKIVTVIGLVDPAMASDLDAQFRANDRIVLLSIAGFGAILVMSIFAAGIFITHKVAGPLYNISRICGRVRDNKLSPSLRQLRKGDELQDFYNSFRDMYEALRTRVNTDVQVRSSAITALEGTSARS